MPAIIIFFFRSWSDFLNVSSTSSKLSILCNFLSLEAWAFHKIDDLIVPHRHLLFKNFSFSFYYLKSSFDTGDFDAHRIQE